MEWPYPLLPARRKGIFITVAHNLPLTFSSAPPYNEVV